MFYNEKRDSLTTITSVAAPCVTVPWAFAILFKEMQKDELANSYICCMYGLKEKKKKSKIDRLLAQKDSHEQLISKYLEGNLEERYFNELQKPSTETCNREG